MGGTLIRAPFGKPAIFTPNCGHQVSLVIQLYYIQPWSGDDSACPETQVEPNFSAHLVTDPLFMDLKQTLVPVSTILRFWRQPFLSKEQTGSMPTQVPGKSPSDLRSDCAP